MLAWAATVAAATPRPAIYQVRRGDSLSLIAQRFGTTVTELRRSNSLHSDVIHVGDRLTIKKPFSRSQRGRQAWQRPLRHPGPILRPFGPYKAGGILMPRTGVEVSVAVGTQFLSPAAGVVRHSGPLDGFGHILIIEHAGHYATVLAPCDPTTLSVRVGQAVLAGDPLARTAAPADPAAKPYAHLELRRNDKAVAPDRLLR